MRAAILEGRRGVQPRRVLTVAAAYVSSSSSEPKSRNSLWSIVTVKTRQASGSGRTSHVGLRASWARSRALTSVWSIVESRNVTSLRSTATVRDSGSAITSSRAVFTSCTCATSNSPESFTRWTALSRFDSSTDATRAPLSGAPILSQRRRSAQCARPQVLGCIPAVGPPALGVRVAEALERAPDAEVGGGKGIEIAAGAQRVVGRGPGADARDGLEVSARARASRGDDGPRPGRRHGQLDRIECRQRLARREEALTRVAAEASAVLLAQPSKDGARRRERDLLVHDRADQELEVVGCARHAQSGPRADQRAELG